MKHLRVLIIMSVFASSISAFAGQAEYDDCILEYMKGVKLDIAANMIKQACEENYKNAEFISDRKREYNNCLLEHLVGVESYEAVMKIKNACGNKYGE